MSSIQQATAMDSPLARIPTPLTLSDVTPGPQEPWRMSFDEIAIALSLCDAGSGRAAHLEQELRRRLVADRRRQARYPAALWFLAGGLVAITAFQLGTGMRTLAPWRHVGSPPAAVATGVQHASLPDLRRG
jgi:hypothetical protein